MRTLALVDGEHYPPVTRWGIEVARARGYDVIAAVFVGGIEKLSDEHLPDLGVPLRGAGEDRTAAVAAAIDELAPDLVLDLSDEPVLGYRERMAVAAEALARGVPYVGSGLPARPAGAARAPAGDPDPRGLRHRQADRQDRRRRRGGAGRGAPRPRAGGGRDGSRRSAGTPGGGGRQRDARAAPRARPVGRACRLRLPGGCAHDRRHDDRRPPGGGRPRGRALRQQRPRSAAACRRSRPRGRDPRGQRCLAATDRLGRRRHRRAGDLPGGVRPRLPGSVPPLAGGSCPGYHGWRTGSRDGERLPPRRASPGFPR